MPITRQNNRRINELCSILKMEILISGRCWSPKMKITSRTSNNLGNLTVIRLSADKAIHFITDDDYLVVLLI